MFGVLTASSAFAKLSKFQLKKYIYKTNSNIIHLKITQKIFRISLLNPLRQYATTKFTAIALEKINGEIIEGKRYSCIRSS